MIGSLFGHTGGSSAPCHSGLGRAMVRTRRAEKDVQGTQGFYAEVACEVLWRLHRLAFAGHGPIVAFLSIGLGPLSGDES